MGLLNGLQVHKTSLASINASKVIRDKKKLKLKDHGQQIGDDWDPYIISMEVNIICTASGTLYIPI